MSRWRKNNAEFVAELNHRRSDLWKATGERILNLRVNSIVALEALLHDDDSRVRFQAAQLVLGLDLKGPVGPTNREDVEAAWRRSALAKADRDHFLDELATIGG